MATTATLVLATGYAFGCRSPLFPGTGMLELTLCNGARCIARCQIEKVRITTMNTGSVDQGSL